MLIYRKPIGTCAFVGGLMALPEEFAWSWAQMIDYTKDFLCQPTEYVHMARSTTSDKPVARNFLVQTFLGDWLWMTDTDHTFEPDIVCRMVSLLSPDVDIITGVYRLKLPPHLPVLFHWDAAQGKYYYISGRDKDGKEWTAPLVRIDSGSAGAGCLLVRRRVFDRIQKELGEQPFDEIRPWREDFSFFARCRKLGIPFHVATQVESQHLTIRPVTAAEYDPGAVLVVNPA